MKLLKCLGAIAIGFCCIFFGTLLLPMVLWLIPFVIILAILMAVVALVTRGE